MELKTPALSAKKKLGIGTVKISGKADLPVKRVAICSGSGSGLMKHFLSPDAEVYISGDFRYNDARAVEALNKDLIDIRHLASEHLIVDNLTARLQKALSETRMDIQVEGCGIEKTRSFF
jgi:putative NIF3 family GTP cyclohydrolase 1 type 2